MNEKEHIKISFATQSDQAQKKYKFHLTTTLDDIQFLFSESLALHGKNEVEESQNQENLVKLL